MHDFNPEYIQLLREQFEQEINYLKLMGHNHSFIQAPCIFCTEGEKRRNGEHGDKYHCNRLKALENFLHYINHRYLKMTERKHNNFPAGKNSLAMGTAPSRTHINPVRRPIGQPVGSEPVSYPGLIGFAAPGGLLLPSNPVDLKF